MGPPLAKRLPLHRHGQRSPAGGCERQRSWFHRSWAASDVQSAGGTGSHYGAPDPSQRAMPAAEPDLAAFGGGDNGGRRDGRLRGLCWVGERGSDSVGAHGGAQAVCADESAGGPCALAGYWLVL